MTVKSFNKALGYLNGFHIRDNAKIVLMCVCQLIVLPLTMLVGDFSKFGAIWAFSWIVFSMLYSFWDIIHITFDPAYSVYNSPDSDFKLEDNKKIIEAAALFPADRFTAVKAFHTKRLIINLSVSAGLVINGIAFMGMGSVAGGSAYIIGVSFFALINILYYALMLYKKGFVNSKAIWFCDVLVCVFGFTDFIGVNEYSQGSGVSVGISMLISAVIILAVTLICYVKCLRDAKNTARNGEPTGGI